MNNFFKNKKAVSGEVYLSPWMFLIWGIIAVGIVIGVFMFYGFENDVRELEADILGVRILDCISNDFKYAQLKEINIYEKCGLDKEVIEDTDNYYIHLNVIEMPNGQSEEVLNIGQTSYKEYCEIQEVNRQTNLPQCSEREIYVYDWHDVQGGRISKKYVLQILVASNQR